MGENNDLLSGIWTWLAHAMGVDEQPGRRVVSPGAPTVKDAYASVPEQRTTDCARPHDAQ
jgi:hypothetical protein